MNATSLIGIPYLDGFEAHNSIEEIALALDKVECEYIQYAPWPDGSKLPSVSFALAFNKNHIYLKYNVEEPTLRAKCSNFNDPVFEDSCVEFFIAFQDDPKYYNLEFNCIGTSRGMYGQQKTNRTFLSVNLLQTIKHQTRLTDLPSGNINWELTLCIPITIFEFHPQLSFEGCKARVNFFKCGDALPNPHFLCWSRIEAPVPEFHLPEFFKEVHFLSGNLHS